MIINTISVEPKRRAEIKRISTETGMLEAELDARHYEIVYPFANEKCVAVIKDEFASLDGKPFNRAFYSDKAEENVETILQGKFLIVGVTEDSFRDLGPDEVEHYFKRFELPENFFVSEGELCVVKFNPEEREEAQNEKLIDSIWNGTYSPQRVFQNGEHEQKTKRLSKAMSDILCAIPESMHDFLGELLEARSDLSEYEKRRAYKEGVDFGRQMYS